jgi:acyl transferase domain-containing protein/NADPH:quinone reductase-like Zn-dependent oxidoreductase
MKHSLIAIVGMGCRFPGGASSPGLFWDLLKSGEDAVVDVPPDRWDMRRFYDPDTDKPGKMHNKQSGFLKESINQFDPLFFGISPREAGSMDPQQRLLLEVTYEAVEDAGLQVEKLKGSATGVFIGGFSLDNKLIRLSILNRHMINTHIATSSSMTMLSNRISYAFDLRGPSISMDTACSSSLVTVHQACQSIWNGESEMAVAGGVNIILLPAYHVVLTKGRFTSKHSRCKAFDQDAAGYVRGEGAGVVILKPYEQALKDKDFIYAVIKASALNQDGQTNGITVPNPEAQKALMKKVYNQANININQVHYIEAHGTGTPVGDQMEMEALKEALLKDRSPGNICLLGSVKTNIGHLEAASGIASLIKTALVLYHQQAPPHLHFKTPNPNVDFQKLPVKVVTKVENLPADETSYACINSFGYGGTNAHMLLREVPKDKNQNRGKPVLQIQDLIKPTDKNHGFFLFPVSTRDQRALKDLTQKYYDFIVNENPCLSDLIYSACFRRSHHKNRLVIAAETKEQLTEGLKSYTRGVLLKGTVENQANIDEKPGIVFVYTGMGPQWWAMGREMMKAEPVFRKKVEECDRVFKKHAGWSILEEMLADEEKSRIGEAFISQPVNLVMQVALTELLSYYGIEPDAVVGHSAGELASAYASGALSLEDTFRVVYHRSQLHQTLAGKGTMLAVGLPEAEVTDLIRFYDDVTVAAVNSPSSVTLSGNRESLEQVASLLEVKGTFNRMLKVNIPYHSVYMDGIKEPFMASIKSVKPGPCRAPFYSAVTGEQMQGIQLDPDYWWVNNRQTVQFGKAILTLINDGYDTFIEVGPHPVLKNSINECLDFAGKEGQLVQTLNRKELELPCFYEGLARLFTLGFDIDWQRISPQGNYIKLPHYPWQREHYWQESELSRQDRLGLPGSVFLNNRVPSPNPQWEVELNPFLFPFINDHKVLNTVVLPGATYAAAGLALSADEFGKDNAITLEDIEFKQILPIDNTRIQMLRTGFNPQTGTYSIYSWFNEEDQGWNLHALGRMLKKPVVHISPILPLEEIKTRCATSIPPDELYQKLAAAQLEYGPHFRVIRQAWKGDGEMMAKIVGHESLADTLDTDGYLVHPTILDGSFQAMALFGHKQMVPVSIRRLNWFHSPGSQCWAHLRIKEITGNSVTGDIRLCDETGRVALEVDQLVCRELVRGDDREMNRMDECFYDFKWQEVRSISAPVVPIKTDTSHWLLFANESEYAHLVSDKLAEAGANVNCIVVTPGDNYKKLNHHHYQIRSLYKDDMQQLLMDTAGLKFPEVLYLWAMRKKSVNPFSLNHTVDQTMPLIYLAQSLAEIRPDETVKITIVTRDSQVVVPGDKGDIGLTAAPLWGLGHLLGNEFPNITAKTIDLAGKEGTGSNSPGEEIETLAYELLPGNTEEDVALRQGKRFVKKLEKVLTPNREQNKKYKMISTDAPVELTFSSPGKIENLYYREYEPQKTGPGEIRIKVHAAGLNYKDLLKVLGRISPKVTEGTYFKDALGMEVSGVITEIGEEITGFSVGDEVITASPLGSFKSYITIDPNVIIRKPKTLSHTEAVIVVPFLTVLYGLGRVAQLQKGEKILIHSATGGVGLAAIQYAQWKGAEIFATAGNPQKREYLKSLGISHVMNSRTLEFAREIREITRGYGVDVVLNATADESLYQSLALLAPYGRFIEIGKLDIAENKSLPMGVFNRNIIFAAIDIDQMMADRQEMVRQLGKEISQGFEQGYFHPLPIQAFPAEKAHEAFNMLNEAKHMGKIALDFHHRQVQVEVEADTTVKKDATYLITGGTKGFGLEIAKWLSANGARYIVLVGRSGANTNEAREAIALMEKQGTTAVPYAVDVSIEKEVKQLLDRIGQTLPPLTGIFHLAMVLDDALLKDVTRERLEKVMAPKVAGAWNLHRYTRHLPLDHFICMSSAASLVGNPGQSAYVAANAYLDAFAHYRAAQGLVATTINLGLLAETGAASRNNDLASMLQGFGIKAFSTDEALQGLRLIMEKKNIQIGLYDIDWKIWASVAPKSANSSRFKELVQKTGDDNHISKKQLELINQLTTMSEKEKQDFVEQILAEELAKILGLEPGRVERNRGINFLGVDSVMVVEFTRAINKRVEVSISAVKLLSGLTISQLAASFLKQLQLHGEDK